MSSEGSLSESVLMESVGAVRILTLNRPEKLNAADLEMQQRLVTRLRAVADDDEARVLILTGTGRAFSAGGDRSILREMAAGDLRQRGELGRVHVETIRCLLEFPIPVIAAVNGPAVGYAAGLVALCDLVVMGEDAFLCDPHVKFGVAATTATQLVWPRLTSYAVAKELLMSGRQVGAKEALRLGLTNRVSPAGQERATALEMSEIFVGLPRAGIAATKRAFNRSLRAEAESLFVAGDDGVG